MTTRTGTGSDCFPDDDFADDDFGDGHDGDDDDPGEGCGRWINGRLGKHCRLAGTEFCDWDCPYSR